MPNKMQAGDHIEIHRTKSEVLHRLFQEYAAIAVEHYFLKFFAMTDVFKETGVYIPNRDMNLLLWSLISYAGQQLRFRALERGGYDEAAVRRIDGGYYAAYAVFAREFNVSYDRDLYYVCGDMNRISDEFSLKAWQVDTWWCGRQGGWRDNLSSDFIRLMRVIKGDLPQNLVNIDAYQRLMEEQYVLRTESDPEINIVYCKDKLTGELSAGRNTPTI